jgi:sirohydrochlorin ferrochelatase
MTTNTLLLVGRGGKRVSTVLETHASRLIRQDGIDSVCTATYENDPVSDLRETLASVPGDRVYAVPMCAAHSHQTTRDVPAALSYVPGEVWYCEPIGRSPAITEAIAERAATAMPPGDDVSLVLVGLGSSSKPYHRQVTEYHAARLSERSEYDEILPCYLLQNPAVECVRYNVSTRRTVAVPLFVTQTESVRERIRTKLDFDPARSEYTQPLSAHDRITDAVHAEFERQRALTGERFESTHEDRLTSNRHPLVTDGEGPPG